MGSGKVLRFVAQVGVQMSYDIVGSTVNWSVSGACVVKRTERCFDRRIVKQTAAFPFEGERLLRCGLRPRELSRRGRSFGD